MQAPAFNKQETMSIQNLIVLSQLNPPAQQQQVLERERMARILENVLDYPLTVIEAGTGYGKSTALISFIKKADCRVYWYSISGPDRDPNLFLAKLLSSFNQLDEDLGQEALRIMDMPESTREESLITLVNSLSARSDGSRLLVLDDFHRVHQVGEIIQMLDWLLENLPADLHIVFATRQPADSPAINSLRVKGNILEIGKEELKFTHEEITTLFETQYGIRINPEDVRRLYEKTEGWAIGLQMVWQSIQNNPERDLEHLLEDQMESADTLFDYLAEEVLLRQDVQTQEFLVKTSILSKLEPGICDFLLSINDSETMLRNLHRMGLFIEELRPNVYRYHQMFREFLVNRLAKDPAAALALHQRIASYYAAHEYWEQAITHMRDAGEYERIVQILENIGVEKIQQGLVESVNYWIHIIPSDLRKKYPFLLFLLGEVNRLTSQFDSALDHYHSAERLYRAAGNNWGVSMALRGQARVYLDTLRPLNADQILQDTLKLLDPEENPDDVADLLSLTAENQLNMGYPEQAQELLNQSNNLKPLNSENDLIQARILLRTGKLKKGMRLLQDREAHQQSWLSSARPQRFHREGTLLLALFHVWEGNTEKTFKYGRRGIAISEMLQSNFVQSVAYMRLGHAYQLQNTHPWNNEGFDQAIRYYEQSMEKVDVTRIHVEPLWGICRALCYSRQVEKAEEVAAESLAIANKAGDQWIALMIQLSLGAGHVLIGSHARANHLLSLVESGAQKVRDPFLLSVAEIWLALQSWQQGFLNTSMVYLEKSLDHIRENEYDFLITNETFLGMPDREMIKPMLLAARDQGVHTSYINNLFAYDERVQTGYHPGYTLWIQTFGTFETWRGHQRISKDEWKRGKAIHLFQHLVANKGKWLTQDQIILALWPDSSKNTARNNLKVVLNALNQALEPLRPSGEPPHFIERRKDYYRLNPHARIVVDADVFEENISLSERENLDFAVSLYHGPFLEDSPMQQFALIQKQYYHQQYLIAAENLLQLLLEENELQAALDLSYKALNVDPVWETGYEAQMTIFHRLNQPSMVHSVYQQFETVMQTQLDMDVSPKFKQLYRELAVQE